MPAPFCAYVELSGEYLGYLLKGDTSELTPAISSRRNAVIHVHQPGLM